MKRLKIKYLLLLVLAVFIGTTTFSYAQSVPKHLKWTKKVGAKKSPSKKKIYNVKDYGAINDGKTMNTEAIQKAIDASAANGGGIVVFDAGEYLTGSVFVKSGVNFRIDKGVTILGSQDINDYKVIDTRVAGIEMEWPAALVNILDQENAMISGNGLIHAQGKVFWDYYWKMRKEEYEPKGLRWIVDYDARRPRTILVANSKNVTVKELNIQQAGFWTVQVVYSSYVTIDGLTIDNNVGGHGPSTDGVDIDSSSWILVQNTDIDCNDDNFCLKAGRDADGLRVNRPTEYVVIRDCIARKGAGLLTLGSETSGSIRHVYASNIKGSATANCLNIKSATTRGGTVEDVYLENVTMDSVGTVLQVSMNWNPTYSYSELPAGYDFNTIPKHWKTLLEKVEPAEKGIPTFRNINMKNVHVKGARKAINVVGLPNSFIENIHLSNVSIEASTAGSVDYSKNWELENFTLKTKDNSKVKIQNSENVEIK
jgi:polygalacturonase